MARSRAKLEIESLIIGSEIVRKLDCLYKQFLETKKKCLIVGRGAIGKAVYNALVPTGKEVRIIDIETSINSVPLDEIDMVIGCTGKHSFCTELTKSVQNQLLLASASSSDREFGAVETRILHAQNNDTHKDYAYRNTILANSGFPINFDGQSVFTPVEKMEVTLALVFISVCHLASNTLPAGIQPFPKEEDEFICTFFKS